MCTPQQGSVQTLIKCLAYIFLSMGSLLNGNQTQNSFTAILKTYFMSNFVSCK